jgi:hypothetical protein
MKRHFLAPRAALRRGVLRMAAGLWLLGVPFSIIILLVLVRGCFW